jgi:broad-specificity NMP kinase
MERTAPNIIMTGTPGVGKTSHCELLAERTGLKHLSVNQVVKDRECHEGWDEAFQSWIVDEDKVGFRAYLHSFLLRRFPPFVQSPEPSRRSTGLLQVNWKIVHG